MLQHRFRGGKRCHNGFIGKMDPQPNEDVVAANRDWYQMRRSNSKWRLGTDRLTKGTVSADSKTFNGFSAATESTKTALACSLAIWITYTYGWPEPYWSCLAIVLSRHADRSASWLLFGKQSCGSALGTFVGIATLRVSQATRESDRRWARPFIPDH